MEVQQFIQEQVRLAREAARVVSCASTAQKNLVLQSLARLVREEAAKIEVANREDLAAAAQAGLPQPLLRRLAFAGDKIAARCRALEAIAALPDPVGSLDWGEVWPGGLEVYRRRVPLGVLAVIYEARPHVTINAGALALKSGNVVLLKGGAEASRTNQVIGTLWQEALAEAGLPATAIQVIATTDREAAAILLSLRGQIDLAIPRGGKSLIRLVEEQARVPILKHYEGICHMYLDETAGVELAVKLTVDSKVYMPEVCNALETLLVHTAAAGRLLPPVVQALRERGVEVRGCSQAREVFPDLVPATEEDWRTEYLDLVLAVRVVDSLAAAIEHINTYGSHHTDAIVTGSLEAAQEFQRQVDSAVVLVNASTMFNDGGELGLGAEMGISTDRLHARGPVGLRDLTTYKYVVVGRGHIMGTR
ncbi:MAG: glutamate-5-semialdehyde dehydrogenase [Clostridia bacterium]|nr:MAG: glutamate-5-semialdehyde dehydrogenase [Clostridia bacterium]